MFVCLCVYVFGRVVTHPVFPLCKTSFSGSFMALLMDTGLVKPCGVRVPVPVRVCGCVSVCVCRALTHFCSVMCIK